MENLENQLEYRYCSRLTPSQLTAFGRLFAEYAAYPGIYPGPNDILSESGKLNDAYTAPEGGMILALAGNESVGFAALKRFRAGMGELTGLYVKPPFRRKGIGWELARRILLQAGEKGYNTVRLRVQGTMEAAPGFCRFTGFHEIPPYADEPAAGAMFFELDCARFPEWIEHSRKLGLIGRSELFSRRSVEEHAFIAMESRFVTYPDGEYAFRTGEVGRRLFIVSSGEIIVSRGSGDQWEPRGTEIARYLPGDCFGELDMFSGAVRDADAKASGETELLVFPSGTDSFAELLRDYPSESANLLYGFLRSVSGRIRRVNDLVKRNSPLVQELKRQVYTDKLTGLFNQAFLKETVDKCCGKGKPPFALLMFKPDNFKNLNDTCGHEAGDLALRIMSGEMGKLVGDAGTVFRFSGNELAILIPQAGLNGALEWADRIRLFVPSIDLRAATGGKELSLTVSVGYILFPDNGTSGPDLIVEVSALPLIGRGKGGNRIVAPEEGSDAGNSEEGTVGGGEPAMTGSAHNEHTGRGGPR